MRMALAMLMTFALAGQADGAPMDFDRALDLSGTVSDLESAEDLPGVASSEGGTDAASYWAAGDTWVAGLRPTFNAGESAPVYMSFNGGGGSAALFASAASVPEPGVLLLLGPALAGWGLFARRRRSCKPH